MTTLVVGASGATGRLLVQQLLERGEQVRIIVRSTDKIPDEIVKHENSSIIIASILELSDSEMAQHVSGCSAIASCLGHNLNFKGLFAPPRRLVTDAIRRMCSAVIAINAIEPVKFVLMNTTGNRNRDLDEHISFSQKCVIALIRLLLPPHADNEDAAEYLRIRFGQDNDAIQWAIVRPDTLIDEIESTAFSACSSPTRSAIFDPGKTSRINVATFMAELILDIDTWDKWKGKMPVIYNMEPEAALMESPQVLLQEGTQRDT